VREIFERADLAKWAMELGLRKTVHAEVTDAELERWADLPQDDPANKNLRKLARKELARRAAATEREQQKGKCPQGEKWVLGTCRQVAHAYEDCTAQTMAQIFEAVALVERQKARRVKAMAGTGHRSGSDTDLIHAEFSAQRGVRQHSPEVLAYLANLPTTGRNVKLRKVARKVMAMRAPERPACPPGAVDPGGASGGNDPGPHGGRGAAAALPAHAGRARGARAHRDAAPLRGAAAPGRRGAGHGDRGAALDGGGAAACQAVRDGGRCGQRGGDAHGSRRAAGAAAAGGAMKGIVEVRKLRKRKRMRDPRLNQTSGIVPLPISMSTSAPLPAVAPVGSP
jgi:hypothetical protein